jgi:uncharacterized protein (DUF362 family)
MIQEDLIMFDELKASVELCKNYCSDFPFSPSENYPEYPFSDYSGSENPVYKSMRNHLRNLGLDAARYNSMEWNPFGEFDLRGKKIVIKPNLVIHTHKMGEDIWSIITHPSLIRVMLDYIYIATEGNCEVIIGDSPVQVADFERLVEICQLNKLCSYFHDKGLNIGIKDFRLSRALCDEKGRIKTIIQSGDSNECCPVNLGSGSTFCDIDSSYKHYRVADYDRREMLKHHYPGHHEYLISRSVLESDFFINLPKVKTHLRAGVTLSLKNLVGINCSKDRLPHHRQGAKSKNSDEYEKFYLFQWLEILLEEHAWFYKNAFLKRTILFLAKVFGKTHRIIRNCLNQKFYTEGSWHGNDTVWRMCLDMNKIMFYSDDKGQMNPKKVDRKYLTILDGIIGGEKEGPLSPTPINSGFTVGAFNPAVSDSVTAVLMGLDPEKIPIIKNSFFKGDWSICDKNPEDITIRSTKKELNGTPRDIGIFTQFEPSSGWKGQIESNEK